VFDAPREALPNTWRLRDEGVWGLLESCIPPITCPAWMCMATSRDPGQLGIYGFRNRVDFSYDRMVVANSTHVAPPTLWQLLSAQGLRSVVVGVPCTYPPKPFDGWLVTSFLAPGKDSDYTHPPELRHEIDEVVPDYVIDVHDFRTDDKEGLLRSVYHMTERRFDLVEHLLTTRPWDLFWFAEMGVDRLYHGFWRYAARDHRTYEPGHRYETVLADYHRYLDERIGRVLGLVPDDTLVLMVSDHGAQTLHGAVCVNDWLQREGYLHFSHQPDPPAPLDLEWIDWSRTRVWGEGGYYGRIFVNVRGREPQGIVEVSEYEALLAELTGKLTTMTDHDGHPLGTRVFRPKMTYRELNGVPPDLIVYFGNLRWRSAGTVGHKTYLMDENDTGPDDANHAQHGILVMRDPRDPTRGEARGASLYDIAPTVLDRLGLPIPPGMIGQPIRGLASAPRIALS